MSLAVPLILWAGLKLGATTNPNTSPSASALQSTARPGTDGLCRRPVGLQRLIIVTTWRCPAWCSTMWCCRCISHHRKAISPLVEMDAPRADPAGDHGRLRLLSIAGAEQDLANLGIVAFVATLQFLPGVLSVLYWPAANRKGFIAGLLAGIGVFGW